MRIENGTDNKEVTDSTDKSNKTKKPIRSKRTPQSVLNELKQMTGVQIDEDSFEVDGVVYIILDPDKDCGLEEENAELNIDVEELQHRNRRLEDKLKDKISENSLLTRINSKIMEQNTQLTAILIEHGLMTPDGILIEPEDDGDGDDNATEKITEDGNSNGADNLAEAPENLVEAPEGKSFNPGNKDNQGIKSADRSGTEDNLSNKEPIKSAKVQSSSKPSNKPNPKQSALVPQSNSQNVQDTAKNHSITSSDKRKVKKIFRTTGNFNVQATREILYKQGVEISERSIQRIVKDIKKGND